HWRALAWAGAGLALAFIALVHASLTAGSLILGFGTALSLFAWQSALLLWLFSLRVSAGLLGVIIYPLSGLCALLALVLPAGTPAIDVLTLPAQLHIILSMVAYGLLTLGAVQALMLALQHRQLRSSPAAGLAADLPPLESMENLLFRLISIGFALLTLAIITGALFIDNLFAQHLAHKTILSLVAWLVFA